MEEHPVWAQGMVLWVMTEIAIIGGDVEQVIGSAIAFRKPGFFRMAEYPRV